MTRPISFLALTLGLMTLAHADLTLTRVDVLDRVFPDRPPVPAAYDAPLATARPGIVPFQFGLAATAAGLCALEVGAISDRDGTALDCTTRLAELVPVPVEANNNGGSKTRVGTRPPEQWMAGLIREAPFEVAEVIRYGTMIGLTPGRTAAVLVEIHVPADAAPGIYAGTLRATQGTVSAKAAFTFEVFPVAAPDRYALHTTYWLSPKPVDLTYGRAPPPWWSEAHWELLEAAGRTLRAYGQDTLLTPLVDGREPLIVIQRNTAGAYTFDFTRFDRWADLFLGLGFETFEGRHVGGGHNIAVPPMAHTGGVWVRDEAQGKAVPLFDKAKDAEPWLAFLPVFYKALYDHLDGKGWLGRYVQCQLDEPRDPAVYRRLADLARAHLPGVKTKDAINSQPANFSPLVDIQVFALTILAANQDLAAQRRANGQGVWVYHCCSPYPPHPNRHLDEPLTSSRLYPWLAHAYGADGYLYWAANMYRGADPYQSSIGPVPNGSQDPGHPPGDNWFFYPTPEGLTASLRMVAFREGLEDHALLTRLAATHPARAKAIASDIARSTTDYAKTPGDYHAARRTLLEALTE